MSFGAYIIGMILVVMGLAYAAYLVGVSSTWIAIGVTVLIGIGIMSGVTHTRRRDPN